MYVRKNTRIINEINFRDFANERLPLFTHARARVTLSSLEDVAEIKTNRSTFLKNVDRFALFEIIAKACYQYRTCAVNISIDDVAHLYY